MTTPTDKEVKTWLSSRPKYKNLMDYQRSWEVSANFKDYKFPKAFAIKELEALGATMFYGEVPTAPPSIRWEKDNDQKPSLPLGKFVSFKSIHGSDRVGLVIAEYSDTALVAVNGSAERELLKKSEYVELTGMHEDAIAKSYASDDSLAYIGSFLTEKRETRHGFVNAIGDLIIKV